MFNEKNAKSKNNVQNEKSLHFTEETESILKKTCHLVGKGLLNN